MSRLVPRLRQRVRGHALSVAPPRWDVDPNFDLDYHLRFMRAVGAGTLREVFDIAEPIAMQGFDRARPLWEFTVVEGLDDDRSALITKIHHAITDGVGGVKLMMEMLDLEADGEQGADPRRAPAPGARGGERHRVPPHRRRRRLRGPAPVRRRLPPARLGRCPRPGKVRADPLGIGMDALTTAGSVVRMVSPATEPLSPLMRDRSLSVHFDTLQVPHRAAQAGLEAGGGHASTTRSWAA